jgi:predicted nucleotidyltransferase component of viral defense system
MNPEPKRNLPASVRQRLLNLSREKKEPFDLILSRYAIERLLYRLANSRYAERFLLKGAMLFSIWTEETYRPTRDVDLLGFGENDTVELEGIFRELCSLPIEPDGLLFHAETVKAERIREEAAYAGIRVTLVAQLENAKIPVQADVGFGDAVTPEADEIIFPALLDLPAPKIRVYPIYTVVAEKLEAMIYLGEPNSRMKDFFDVWFLSQRFEFSGQTLTEAIQATFQRRKTPLPHELPAAFSKDLRNRSVVSR